MRRELVLHDNSGSEIPRATTERPSQNQSDQIRATNHWTGGTFSSDKE